MACESRLRANLDGLEDYATARRRRRMVGAVTNPISDKPYDWGGTAAGDCSGRMQELAKQQQAGMSMEDMMQSMADDYQKVLDRMADQ